jgi:regulator of replication initiation timing
LSSLSRLLRGPDRTNAEAPCAASKQLITELKSELADQKAAAKETQRLRKTIVDHEATIAELQKKVAEMTEGVAQGKKENKALQTKLAASRLAEASNAIKSTVNGGNGGPAGATASKAADAVHASQLKEDLFSDLTGLIITGVKFHDKDDIFDCLQTGRNGSKYFFLLFIPIHPGLSSRHAYQCLALHFKLAIETEMTGDGYEEEQVTYRPQLDPSRDQALIDILPDYLVEEITFPRPHAGKFYTRVLKALTERVEEE